MHCDTLSAVKTRPAEIHWVFSVYCFSCKLYIHVFETCTAFLRDPQEAQKSICISAHTSNLYPCQICQFKPRNVSEQIFSM